MPNWSRAAACLVLWSLCVHPSTPWDIPTRQDEDSTEADTVTGLRVVYPVDGDVESLPLIFQAEIEVKSDKEFTAVYHDKVFCVELNGKWKRCSSLANPILKFEDLPLGNYTAQAFIADEGGDFRYHATPALSLSIMTKEDFNAYSDVMIEKSSQRQEVNGTETLLAWAKQRQEQLGQDSSLTGVSQVPSPPTNGSDFLLVVGVKTAVVEKFIYRQTIRETWANRDVLPRDVKVVFIGCEPVFDEHLSDAEQHQILNAIALEKHTYGDLLTNELHCRDSYADLADKVKAFLRFAAQMFPQTPFVTIADDDIYLRADRLADELRKEYQAQRLYIGQVWDNLLGRSQRPMREAGERYYVSEDSYPLKAYPPFAFGPHYVLSMDCVQFIAKNSNRLQGLELRTM